MNGIEFLYYLGLSAKKFIATGKRKRLPCRVISVGNVTVGGTGKTPATIAIAEEAEKRGMIPVILTRGYKGTAQGPCFVTRGERPLLTAEQAGDEPLLMAERLRGVPIVKGADRYAAGLFAIEELGLRPMKSHGADSDDSAHSPISPARRRTPVFILDDGFQHWRLHRDKDIVLIDGTNPFGNGRLLPLGRLREPLTCLARGDIIVVTKTERQDSALLAEIRRYNNRAPVFFSGHRAVSLRSRSGDRRHFTGLDGQRVYCFCGLADPASFSSTVASAGADIAGVKAYPDHHRYTPRDIAAITKESLASGVRWIITTEKDMVKLRNLDLPENILIIEIAFTADQSFYESVFA